MSTCINKNAPEFQSLLNNTTDSEGVVAAVVSLWQKNNGVDLIPSITEYEDYKTQIQVQGNANMSYEYFQSLAYNLNKNWVQEKGESVSRTLQRFKGILSNNEEGANINFLQDSLKKLLLTSERGVITPEFTAQAIEDLTMYLNRSSLYLDGMIKGLETFLESDASTKNKIAALFIAHETADNFKRQIQAIFPQTPEFKNLTNSFKPKEYKKLLETRKAINDNINTIEDLFETRLTDKVVDELWELFAPYQEEVNSKLMNAPIKELEAQLAKAKTEGQKRILTAKIKRQEEFKEKNALTKSNISKWIQNPKSSWFALMMKSGSYSADPGVQVIAKYIFNVIEDAQKEFFQEANQLQDIMERIQTLMGENLDIRNMYEGLYRETVDEFGNFALVLQTQMKDQELRNEYFRLRKAINDAETDEERKKAVEDKNQFEAVYVERFFKDEYYEFRKMLPEDVRDKLEDLRNQKNAIINSLDGITISEQALEEIKQIEKQIRDLGKEYDDFGNLKSPEEVETAKLIQAYNQRAQELGVHDFYLEPSSKKQFEFALQEQEQRLKEIVDNPQATAVEKEVAEEEYARWLSYYSRNMIAPEYYTFRKRITDKIDAIISKYEDSSLSKNYRQLFNMLLGFRDSNGVYDGTQVDPSLAGKVKDLEEEIEKLKEADTKSKMTKEDAAQLKMLFKQLREFQYTSNTEYYKEEVENRKNLILSSLLEDQEWDDGNLLGLEVDRLFKESDWFKENHIYITRYVDGNPTLVPQPIMIWRQTMPSEYAIDLVESEAKKRAEELEAEDPIKHKERINTLKNFKVIQEKVPSKVWYKYRVNPKLQNPNYSKNTNFKVVKGAYYNDEWDNLSPEKKRISEDLLKLYLEAQKGSYYQNQMNTIVPYVRKEGLELAVDTAVLGRKGAGKRYVDGLKAIWTRQDLQNPEVDDVYGNVDQTDAFGNPLEVAAKSIYMRYVNPLDKGVVSFDIMKSIGLYLGESAKFRALRENQNSILAMQSIAEKKGETAGTRITESIIDRVMYGENMKNFDEEARKKVLSILNATLKRSGAMSLDQNLLSAVKNLQAGMVQNFILAGNYDITAVDLARARGRALDATKDFVLNPQVGNRPLSLRILDHFGAIQGRDFSQGALIKSTPLRKFGNLFKTAHRFREWTEFEIQATLAFAIMDKVYVNGPNNTKIKLSEAYAIQNNQLVVKDGYTVPDHLLRQVRAKIKHMNHHSQGLYDQIYQPEGTKYVMYRVLFYMGKWRAPKWERYFGTEYVDYMAAVRSRGAYGVLWDFVTDVIKYERNIIAAYGNLTEVEKKQLAPIWKTMVTMASYIILQSLLQDCDDDGQQDTCDYVNWLTKGVGDEVESLDPIISPINFIYGFVDQKTQVSAPEKIMNHLLAPVLKVWKIFSDPAMRLNDPFEPYYKKTSTGKINWNTTDPAYAGKPILAVLALKLSGYGELDISPERVEFKSRSFTHFNPKIYAEKTKTKYVNERRNVEKIKFKEEEEEEGKSTSESSSDSKPFRIGSKSKSGSFRIKPKFKSSKRGKKSSLYQKYRKRNNR